MFLWGRGAKVKGQRSKGEGLSSYLLLSPLIFCPIFLQRYNKNTRKCPFCMVFCYLPYSCL